MWKYLAEHSTLQTDMMNYMAGRRKGSQRWLDIFPAGSRFEAIAAKEDAVLLVDVGGNKGHDLMLFKERFPDIRGRLVLEDLPEATKNVAPSEGIKIFPYDFFTPQPLRGNPTTLPLETIGIDILQELTSITSMQSAMIGRTRSAEGFLQILSMPWTKRFQGC